MNPHQMEYKERLELCKSAGYIAQENMYNQLSKVLGLGCAA